MTYLLVASAVIWAWGWIGAYRWADTKDESLWGKVKMAAMLFVLWPYILWMRLTMGDQ